MTKPGLRLLKCESCGQTKELEAGIKNMYCCAQLMVDVTEEEAEKQEPTLRLKPRQ